LDRMKCKRVRDYLDLVVQGWLPEASKSAGAGAGAETTRRWEEVG